MKNAKKMSENQKPKIFFCVIFNDRARISYISSYIGDSDRALEKIEKRRFYVKTKQEFISGWTSNLQSKIMTGDYGFEVKDIGEVFKDF